MNATTLQTIVQKLFALHEDVKVLQESLDHIDEPEHAKWCTAGLAIIPFGKFAGFMLKDVNLRYLDQTVSQMPDQWIVRQARIVVDVSMVKYSLREVPNCTYMELKEAHPEID